MVNVPNCQKAKPKNPNESQTVEGKTPKTIEEGLGVLFVDTEFLER